MINLKCGRLGRQQLRRKGMNRVVNVALLGKNSIVREGLGRILAEQAFRITDSTNNSSGIHDFQDQEDEGAFLILVDTNEHDQANIEDLRRRFPSARIVLLADEFNFDVMVDAFSQGIHGYLVKNISCDNLVGALHLVASGEKVLPSQLADELSEHIPAYQKSESTSLSEARLSDRELEILRCLIMGCPNKVISRRLTISEATVKVHVKAVLRKLHVTNRTQAAIWATNSGLRAFETKEQCVEEVSQGAPVIDFQLPLQRSPLNVVRA